ncbi:cation/H(+) antiporter 4-like [Gastrolobium bilobum]|uniref:cation/H(+) antiporter 4-like n=1 Tax=Gastrolobium bilobum TaxID=150636 RepID=UPI002AB09072|nr:cation/H(+) antiporter 4-like [Gastrolobium bilobum]
MEAVNQTIFDFVRLNKNVSDPDFRFFGYDVCIDLPPRVASDGIWGQSDFDALPSKSTLPLFELQILTIFIITQCFHLVLKRMGLPYFVSQLMAGIVLGPSIKIEALTKYKNMLFPMGSEDVLTLISVFGYMWFLFLNCVQMDYSMITRTGRKAWTIALASLLIPTFIGLTISYRFMDDWISYLGLYDGSSLPVIVISHSSCSFPVIASLLSDLEILNSELGRLALSSALVSDAISTFGSGLGTSIMRNSVTQTSKKEQVNGSQVALFSALKYMTFLVVVPLIARPAMRWIVRKTPEGRPVRRLHFTIVIILTLLAAMFGGILVNQTVLAGVLLVGLAVPEGPPLGSELVKKFELFNTWFLLPLFVTSCAMKLDFTVLINHRLILTLTVTIIVIHLLKILITIGICKYCHMPITDGLCLGLMLSCKGVVDFCTHIFLHDALFLSKEAIALMTISVLVLGSMAHIGVKALYDPSRKYAGYQKRNILHLKPNSELRIVACIRKPSHTHSIRDALDIFCPTSNNPLVVHVMHLMELVGRSSPIFISHRLQERVGSARNFSEDVIVTFDLFEHDYAGNASVSTYTAISPLRFMQDDVCYLALDKLASIIILPFHIRWADDGSVESDDENIRTLNCKVLERAPCSVGILVNRGSSSNNDTGKQIAMIFLGGADDREALCLAKRAIKECTFNLVVYHLVASTSEVTNWDYMLDEEVLKGVKGYYGPIENVKFEKITIDGPSETTALVSEIADQHDFIIVGRRNGVKSPQTEKLESWTEFSELGVIGDLLASSDNNTKASILVVQQQQLPKS